MKRLVILLLLLLPTIHTVFAQDGGQLWVTAFEDRNADGSHDPNEPFITRGVSVNLLDADGVIVASALLDDSPNASRGLVGFQRLSPGTYTLEVISPDLTPTTPTSFTQTVEANVMPTVLWFGAQRAAAVVEESSTAPASILTGGGEIARLAISLLGAALVVGAFSAIGFMIYLVAFAPRAAKLRKISTSTTGSMRAVRVDETGEIRKTRG